MGAEAGFSLKRDFSLEREFFYEEDLSMKG